MYTCRNLGQVALKWPGQPAPTGPGWIEVKREPLIRLCDIEELLKRCQSHICGGETSSASKRVALEEISAILKLNVGRLIP